MSPKNFIRWVRHNPKKSVKLGLRALARPFGGKRFTRFIVLTRSRSGSNLLSSYLNSHRQVYTRGEIFWNLNGRDWRQMLDREFAKEPAYIKARGFKIFYYHPQDDPECGLWEHLESMQDLHVIHLRRENLLRVLTSRKIAGASDIWATHQATTGQDGEPIDKRVRFSVEELEAAFLETRQWEAAARQQFAANPFLEICYEDMVANRQKIVNEVAGFLDVESFAAETTLKKQNPEPLSDLIINYDELKAHFANSLWSSFFGEGDTKR